MNWTGHGREGFDDRVEAMYRRLNKSLEGDAYAVNGRGGDEGIDIYIDRDGRVTVVQVKFFPEGFAGGFAKSRRPQIERSFRTALQHAPDEWVLVVPATLRSSERKFVRGLAEAGGPHISIIDLPSLNEMAAGMPDLVAYFERDSLMDAAKTLNQERALLVDSDDLVARVAALADRADTLHPDWRLDFFRVGDVIGRQLVARHPQAAERSPVRATLGIDLTLANDDIRRAIRRSLGFGTPERLDLPSALVTKFEVQGPPFIAISTTNVDISLIPDTSTGPDHVVVLRATDPEGRTAHYTGRCEWLGSAAEGRSLQARFFDVMRVELLLPFDRDREVTLTVEVDAEGRDPAGVLRALTAAERLRSAVQVEVTVAGEGPLVYRRVTPLDDQSVAGAWSTPFATMRAIAEDLVVVQPMLDCYFGFPKDPTRIEMIELRCLRLMLQGHAVVLPGADQVTPILNGIDSTEMRDMLAQGPSSILITQESFAYELFGESLVAGQARFYAPQMSAVDAPRVIAALRDGRAAGMKMTLRTEPGYGIWMFLPERFREDPDGKIRPVPLELPGVAEAADVARARFGDGAVPVATT